MGEYHGKSKEGIENTMAVAADWTKKDRFRVDNKKPGYGYRFVQAGRISAFKADGWEDAGDAGERCLKANQDPSNKDSGIWINNMKLLRLPKHLKEARDAFHELQNIQAERAARQKPNIVGAEVQGLAGDGDMVKTERRHKGKK